MKAVTFTSSQSLVLVALLACFFVEDVRGYGYYGAIDSAFLVNQLIFFAVSAVISLFVSIFMYNSLVQKDNLLPPQQRFMNGGATAAFWLVCLCFGCLGTLIFYLVASSDINRRLMMVQGAQPTVTMMTVPAQPYIQPYAPAARPVNEIPQQVYTVQ